MKLPLLILFLLFTFFAHSQSSTLVISQVYGGAGCGTANCSTYKNDYIEIFNKGTTAVSLNGYSVQYAAATGTAWQVTLLTNVTLQPGQYYLIAEGTGVGGANSLPTPDVSGTVAMSATAAKVALVNSTTALSGACPSSASIVDFVGYGSTANCKEGNGNAPAPSLTTAALRRMSGCTETNDNSSDFTATTPTPRNTASALASCPPPLPVSLVSFDASYQKGQGVFIRWKTASEQNTAYFEVLRSLDKRNSWQAVGKVAAAGNSTEVKQYNLQDNLRLAGVVMYRLRQVDHDAVSKLSGVVSVKIETNHAFILSPNPTKGIVYITTMENSSSRVLVQVFRPTGELLYRSYHMGSSIQLNLPSLTNGVYVLRVGNETMKLLISR